MNSIINVRSVLQLTEVADESRCIIIKTVKTVPLHANQSRTGGKRGWWSALNPVRFTPRERGPIPIVQKAEWAWEILPQQGSNCGLSTS